MAIARYSATGALDASYGGDGRVTINFATTTYEAVEALIIDSNNRVIVGGAAESSFALARTLSNGALDTSFDGDGKVITDFSSQESTRIQGLAFWGGRIVAFGWASGAVGFQFAGARYLTNGSLDTALDGDGKVLTDFVNTNQDVASGVVVDGSGRIIAVGESGVAVPVI